MAAVRRAAGLRAGLVVLVTVPYNGKLCDEFAPWQEREPKGTGRNGTKLA
jgi:hypothetical protein